MRRYTKKTEATVNIMNALSCQDAPVMEIPIDGDEPWWFAASVIRDCIDPVGFIAQEQGITEEHAAELITRAKIRFVG